MATNEILAKLTALGYKDEGTLPGWERLDMSEEVAANDGVWRMKV